MKEGTRMNKALNSRWTTPAVALLLGVAFFVASLIAGDVSTGIGSFVIMAVLGATFALGGGSETIRLMRQPDERWKGIDTKAMAASGGAMTFAVIAGSLVRIAQGRQAGEFGIVAVAGALTYVIALVWLRYRS
jgi:hypothetical protein